MWTLLLWYGQGYAGWLCCYQASRCNTWPEQLWIPWWVGLVPGWLCTRPCCDCCGYTGGQGWLLEWLAASPSHDCCGYTGVWARVSRMGATLKVYWCQPELLTMRDGMGAFWQEPVRVGLLGRAGPSVQVSSVQFSHSVMSNSLQPHGLRYLSITNSWSLLRLMSQWCHPTILSSVVPFSSCLQSFPASGSFPMSQLFSWGGQSIGVSASVSVLPMNIQDWFPLGWTGWISLQSKGLSGFLRGTLIRVGHLLLARLIESDRNGAFQCWASWVEGK